jgi:sulfate transport system permease protein
MTASRFRKPSILPGFGLTLGFTTFFLSAIVLLPLAALVFKTASLTWTQFLAILLDPRAVASYRLSFGAALLAATINAVFGFVVAWALVRYEFPGRRLVDALRSRRCSRRRAGSARSWLRPGYRWPIRGSASWSH